MEVMFRLCVLNESVGILIAASCNCEKDYEISELLIKATVTVHM